MEKEAYGVCGSSDGYDVYSTVYRISIFRPNYPPTCSLVHLSIILYLADHSLASLAWQAPCDSIYYIFSLGMTRVKVESISVEQD